MFWVTMTVTVIPARGDQAASVVGAQSPQKCSRFGERPSPSWHQPEVEEVRKGPWCRKVRAVG